MGPVWIVVAVIWPLHTLKESNNERNAWMFYWILYVSMAWLFFFFEWVIFIPFYILGFYIDIYFEAQIALTLFLVAPQTQGIKKLLAFAEKSAEPFRKIAEAKIKETTRRMTTRVRTTIFHTLEGCSS